jgi:metallo-beta-lactamase family protein
MLDSAPGEIIPMANVTFYGACGVVTGSCTLLSWSDRRVLVDCGFYQGDEELELRGESVPW